MTNGTVIAEDRRKRCDRRSEGIETTLSSMSKDEFSKYFKNFQKKSDLQLLHKKGGEFPYLVICYKDEQGKSTTNPTTIYAFREQDISSKPHDGLLQPTIVKNIHGSNVYQSYIDKDITKAKARIPTVIKTWIRNRESLR